MPLNPTDRDPTKEFLLTKLSPRSPETFAAMQGAGGPDYGAEADEAAYEWQRAQWAERASREISRAESPTYRPGTLGRGISDVETELSRARNDGARGDANGAASRLAKVSRFVEDNNDALSRAATYGGNNPGQQSLAKLAQSLIDGSYLRDNVFTDPKTGVGYNLASLSDPKTNPGYEQYLRSFRGDPAGRDLDEATFRTVLAVSDTLGASGAAAGNPAAQPAQAGFRPGLPPAAGLQGNPAAAREIALQISRLIPEGVPEESRPAFAGNLAPLYQSVDPKYWSGLDRAIPVLTNGQYTPNSAAAAVSTYISLANQINSTTAGDSTVPITVLDNRIANDIISASLAVCETAYGDLSQVRASDLVNVVQAVSGSSGSVADHVRLLDSVGAFAGKTDAERLRIVQSLVARAYSATTSMVDNLETLSAEADPYVDVISQLNNYEQSFARAAAQSPAPNGQQDAGPAADLGVYPEAAAAMATPIQQTFLPLLRPIIAKGLLEMPSAPDASQSRLKQIFASERYRNLMVDQLRLKGYDPSFASSFVQALGQQAGDGPFDYSAFHHAMTSLSPDVVYGNLPLNREETQQLTALRDAFKKVGWTGMTSAQQNEWVGLTLRMSGVDPDEVVTVLHDGVVSPKTRRQIWVGDLTLSDEFARSSGGNANADSLRESLDGAISSDGAKAAVLAIGEFLKLKGDASASADDIAAAKSTASTALEGVISGVSFGSRRVDGKEEKVSAAMAMAELAGSSLDITQYQIPIKDALEVLHNPSSTDAEKRNARNDLASVFSNCYNQWNVTCNTLSPSAAAAAKPVVLRVVDDRIAQLAHGLAQGNDPSAVSAFYAKFSDVARSVLSESFDSPREGYRWTAGRVQLFLDDPGHFLDEVFGRLAATDPKAAQELTYDLALLASKGDKEQAALAAQALTAKNLADELHHVRLNARVDTNKERAGRAEYEAGTRQVVDVGVLVASELAALGGNTALSVMKDVDTGLRKFGPFYRWVGRPLIQAWAAASVYGWGSSVDADRMLADPTLDASASTKVYTGFGQPPGGGALPSALDPTGYSGMFGRYASAAVSGATAGTVVGASVSGGIGTLAGTAIGAATATLALAASDLYLLVTRPDFDEAEGTRILDGVKKVLDSFADNRYYSTEARQTLQVYRDDVAERLDRASTDRQRAEVLLDVITRFSSYLSRGGSAEIGDALRTVEVNALRGAAAKTESDNYAELARIIEAQTGDRFADTPSALGVCRSSAECMRNSKTLLNISPDLRAGQLKAIDAAVSAGYRVSGGDPKVLQGLREVLQYHVDTCNRLGNTRDTQNEALQAMAIQYANDMITRQLSIADALAEKKAERELRYKSRYAEILAELKAAEGARKRELTLELAKIRHEYNKEFAAYKNSL